MLCEDAILDGANSYASKMTGLSVGCAEDVQVCGSLQPYSGIPRELHFLFPYGKYYIIMFTLYNG